MLTVYIKKIMDTTQELIQKLENSLLLTKEQKEYFKKSIHKKECSQFLKCFFDMYSKEEMQAYNAILHETNFMNSEIKKALLKFESQEKKNKTETDILNEVFI